MNWMTIVFGVAFNEWNLRIRWCRWWWSNFNAAWRWWECARCTGAIRSPCRLTFAAVFFLKWKHTKRTTQFNLWVNSNMSPNEHNSYHRSPQTPTFTYLITHSFIGAHHTHHTQRKQRLHILTVIFILILMVSPSLKPRFISCLGAWLSCSIFSWFFTHLKWSCSATFRSNESDRSPNPSPKLADRPEHIEYRLFLRKFRIFRNKIGWK